MFESFGDAVRKAVADEDPEEAKRLLGEIVSRARDAGDLRQTVRGLRALAEVEAHLGHDDAVFSLYRDATSVARELGESRLLAHTIRHEGDFLRRAGRYGAARPCYVEALELYRGEATTSPLDLANAVRPMALLLEALGEARSAREHWQEASRLYQRAGIQAGVDECAAALVRLDRIAAQ